MLFIEYDVIYLTRGDDAGIDVSLTAGGVPYQMQEGDVLTLTVRERPSPDSPVLIEVHSETPHISITHEDTANVASGAYSADVQLLTADGKRITVFPKPVGQHRTTALNWRNFVVMPEVTTE